MRTARKTIGTDLSRKAYDHIHRSILSGSLPQGAVVSESSLARQIGVSRTPVGEAIRQLAAEGLVEQIPRFGTVVRRIDRRELTELYELRLVLECHAASRAAQTISPMRLAQLQAVCKVIEEVVREAPTRADGEIEERFLQRFLPADMAFHLLVIRACENRRLIKVVHETRTISRIFQLRRHRHDLSVVAQAHQAHLLILDALRRRDGEAARNLMAEHIQTSLQYALDGIDHTAHLPADDVLDSIDLPQEVRRQIETSEQFIASDGA